MSLPNVQVLHDRFADDPHVSVLALHWEDRGAILDHMAHHGFTFTLVPNGAGAWNDLGVVRFPSLLVVGRDGRVIWNLPSHRISDEVRDEIVRRAVEARGT